ncbi:MAG TPA: hypothetical protein EYG82_07395 [Sulfurovum sp.]|nr:hypothetical protein [Sulfurovum sp.]
MRIFYTFFALATISFASGLTAMENACERGVSEACFGLGVIYSEENGLKIDIEKAKKYYTQACDLNEDRACVALENLSSETKK